MDILLEEGSVICQLFIVQLTVVLAWPISICFQYINVKIFCLDIPNAPNNSQNLQYFLTIFSFFTNSSFNIKQFKYNYINTIYNLCATKLFFVFLSKNLQILLRSQTMAFFSLKVVCLSSCNNNNNLKIIIFSFLHIIVFNKNNYFNDVWTKQNTLGCCTAVDENDLILGIPMESIVCKKFWRFCCGVC